MSNNESFYTPPTLPNGDRDRRKEIDAWKRERNRGNAPLDLSIIVVIDNLLDALDEARKERDDAREERDTVENLNGRLADILTKTANALRGEPGENELHSWHDLPARAARMREEMVLRGRFDRAARMREEISDRTP